MTFLHHENRGLGFRSPVEVQILLWTNLAEWRELRERKGGGGIVEAFFFLVSESLEHA